MPEPREPRVFGYARASTKKQEASPDTQKETIKKYAAFNDLPDPTMFIDPATSGKTRWEERIAGAKLMKELQPGDHVILAKLDRAFRRLSDAALMLERFERMHIKLHVCNLMGGALDLSSPMGRFLVHIIAAFAELERAFISERTKDGLANKKRKGIAHTRFPGYGFRWETKLDDGKRIRVRVADSEERSVMRSIAEWRLQDEPLSWTEISRHLTFNLNLKTKEGGRWDKNRVRRACHAELRLQAMERRAKTA